MSDALRTLFILFAAAPLPCGGGSPGDGGNLAVLDVNGDAAVDLSDAIHLLQYLFLSGSPPAGGTRCIPVDGCVDACR